MFPFYALFAVWALGAIQFSAVRVQKLEGILFSVAILGTVIMMGLRYEVGGDWESYLATYEALYFQPLSYALTYTDPAYGLINWLAIQLDAGIWLVNLICAAVFVWGVSALARQQRNAWLAFTVATPYLLIVVGMGYTRQAAAIGVICWAIARAPRSSIQAILFGVFVAALFHKTAILFLPVLLAPMLTRKPVYAAIGIAFWIILASALIGSTSDRLVTNYVNSDYQSSGAAIRIGMNVVAAIVFLVFRSRYQMDRYTEKLWTYCSYLSLVCVVGLVTTSSSVGVDRLALFLIPLQMVVFSDFPYALSKKQNPERSLFMAVLLYSFSVQYVYFTYASFSWAWVPYQNVIFSDTTVQRLP